MSRIPDDKLIEHIADGMKQMTPDYTEKLWNCPVEPAGGTEWYLDATEKKPGTVKKIYLMGTIAACLVLCLISSILFQLMPTASVYLDVNPSVELKVNNRDRVTEAIPRNPDAAEILADMDLKGTDLDVALYAVLGSMVQHGYLTETEDTVLVSVSSANASRADELKTAVSDLVAQNLDEMIHAGDVLSQQISGGGTDHGSTDGDTAPGRTAFIENLKDKYPQLEEENLEDLTVAEIIDLLDEDELDYSEYKNGDPSETEPDDDDDDDDDDDGDDDDDDDDDYDDDEDSDEDD